MGNEYTDVYIVHIPIVVFLAYTLQGIELAPLLKFGVVSAIIIRGNKRWAKPNRS